MRAFQHIETALRVHHGPGSLEHLGRELDRVNSRRAVVVCTPSLAREGSPLGLVREAMGERWAGVFSAVRMHSPLPAVLAATAELARLKADAVVAVGGGSAIVTARAASILWAEGDDLDRLATSIDADGRLRSPRLAAEKLPQIAVPTTPTTATVKAGSAVYDPGAKKRRALFDPKTRAQAVFIDPELIRPVPAPVFVSASLNTFAMAIEGLMSRTGDPIADALLMHAVRLVARNIVLPFEDDIRGELMLAALLCGRGTDHTSGGVTSALGHAIGARHDMENGIANAIVLPLVLRFNAGASDEGLRKVALALDLKDAGDLVPALVGKLTEIFERVGVPRRLGEAGIARDALPGLARLAMEDWFVRGNPRPVREAAELTEILEEAW